MPFARKSCYLRGKTMKTLFRTLLGLAAVLPVLSSCQGLFSEGQGIIRFQEGRDGIPLQGIREEEDTSFSP